MLINAPNLKHFQLEAKANKSMVNGERWQVIAKNLLTFNFEFDLASELTLDDLNSYQTPFWIKEKRWFVAYENSCFYSVPHFLQTYANRYFTTPEFSTVIDKQVFVDHVQELSLTDESVVFNYRFNAVKDLCMYSYIPLSTLREIVPLNLIHRLSIENRLIDNILIQELLQSLTNLHKLCVEYCNVEFLKICSFRPMMNIRTLEISHLESMECQSIEQLARTFPNVEHLHIGEHCSVDNIYEFLKIFSRLSTASFCVFSNSSSSIDRDSHRRNIQCSLDEILSRNYTNLLRRYSTSSIYIWM